MPSVSPLLYSISSNSSGRTNECPPVFYRTSSPLGPLPCFLSLHFTITQSRATGIADHISPLGDLLVLLLLPKWFVSLCLSLLLPTRTRLRKPCIRPCFCQRYGCQTTSFHIIPTAHVFLLFESLFLLFLLAFPFPSFSLSSRVLSLSKLRSTGPSVL